MALNKYVGYGLSSLMMFLVNKRNSKSSNGTASDLNVTENATKIGQPIPVILGRSLVKAPLIAYWGDFKSKTYTEEYSGWSSFDGWILVLSLISVVLKSPTTGHQVGATDVNAELKDGSVIGNAYGGHVTVTVTGTGNGSTDKDDLITPLLNTLWTFLLDKLINGGLLKTTIQKGFKYYLGYQYLVCWTGDNIGIKSIWMDAYDTDTEKSSQTAIWESGIATKKNNPNGMVISIDKSDLFGGGDEGGGFVGDMHVYFGSPTQVPDTWMVDQMKQSTVQENLRGLTPTYRQFMSIVVPTAYIGKQSTIPETWIEIVNIPDGLGLGAIGEDTNPAECIYEAHINTSWGLSESADKIDLDSLIAMGKTLATEKMGISVQINTMTTARNLINNICEHVNAVHFDDPHTGKTVYKLIRLDYDTSKLLVLDTSNCVSSKFTRLDWTETVSSVCVSYTDATEKYETCTVPVNDSANMKITNTLTAKTYDYTLFTTAENALTAAQREGMSQGYPLASVSIVANREAYDLRIGDCFIYKWAPYGVDTLVMRVTDVNLGDFKTGQISIEALEDVFGFNKQVFTFPSGAESTSSISYPTGVQNYRFVEMPYEYKKTKDTYVYGLAEQPSTTDVSWSMWRLIDNLYSVTNTLSSWTPTAQLVYSCSDLTDYIDADGFEILEIGTANNISGVKNDIELYSYTARSGGNLLMVDDEIMAFDSLLQLPNGDWQVKGIIRGVYDTILGSHGAHAIVYFLRSGNIGNVTGNKALIGEGLISQESLNITTQSTDASEALDNSKAVSLLTKRRSERPSLPGDFKIGYMRKDENNDYTVLDRYFGSDIFAGDIEITIEPRDKFSTFNVVSQSDSVDYNTGVQIVPADNVHYIISVTIGGITINYDKVAKTVLNYITTVNKEFTYTWEQRCTDFPNTLANATDITFKSNDGSLDSYNLYERSFTWRVPTMCAICTEINAIGVMETIGSTTSIIVPDTIYNEQFVVDITTAPLILLGTVGTENTLTNYDGAKLVPTGQAYMYCGKSEDTMSYILITLGTNYVLKSYINDIKTIDPIYYKWDGTRFNIINLTEDSE